MNLFSDNLDFFNSNWLACKLSVYSTYVFSFLSIWFVVAFSVERFVVIYFPFSKYSSTHKTIKKLSILLLFVFSFGLYSFSLHTTGLEELTSRFKRCVTLQQWFQLVEKFTLFDILLTIIIPLLVIFVFNILISFKLMTNRIPDTHFLDESIALLVKQGDLSRINSKAKMASNSTPGGLNEIEKVAPVMTAAKQSLVRSSSMMNGHISVNNKIKSKRRKAYSKTTRMLLVISTIFLVLNLPMAVSKFRYFVQNILIFSAEPGFIEFSADDLNFNFTALMLDDYADMSGNSTYTLDYADLFNNSHGIFLTINREPTAKLADEIIERIACYLYYLNFSINFILYTLNGPKFKDTLLKIIAKLSQIFSSDKRRNTI